MYASSSVSDLRTMLSRNRFWSTTSEWMLVDSYTHTFEAHSRQQRSHGVYLSSRPPCTRSVAVATATHLLQLADLQRQVADLLVVLLLEQPLCLLSIVCSAAADLLASIVDTFIVSVTESVHRQEPHTQRETALRRTAAPEKSASRALDVRLLFIRLYMNVRAVD